MGLFSRKKPKIKVQTSKRDSFSGWLKCTNCTELVHTTELEQNLQCCPKCNYHYRFPAQARVELLADPGTFVEKFGNLEAGDPLKFVDSEPYPERLAKAKAKTGRNEAVMVGTCTIGSVPCALGVMDFAFMGGSMGSVMGERLTLLMELALEERRPLVLVTTSGGARMQESIFSLMQMAKTSAALARLHDAKIPYITILTNPTTGGVTASFASLGDVILAEPEALICFAGPRVIEQTIGQKLPPGAQRSEFLLEHGMIDKIVTRHAMRDAIVQLVQLLWPSQDKQDTHA